MRIQPSIGSVVGQTNNMHWGQVLMSPHAYGVVEIDNQYGQARQRGVTILSKLSERLDEHIVSLDLVKDVALRTKEDDVVSLIVLVPVGIVVYIVVLGQGAVYLKRGDQLACLVSGESAISGEVKEGDTLLLVSKAFTHALVREQLASVFDHLPPTEIAEKLTLLLHEVADGVGSAALIFHVRGLTPVENEEIPVKINVPPQHTAFAQASLGDTPALRDRLGVGFIKRVSSSSQLRRIMRLKLHLPQFIRESNMKVAIIAGIFIVLFITSVILGIRKQLISSQSRIVAQTISDAQYAFDEGIALMDLNPVKGRERLTQAKMFLEPLVATVSAKTKEGRQIAALFNEVNDNLTQAMQVVRSEPQIFYDVSLLKKGGRTTHMALSGDALALLDAQNRTVYAVSLSSKSGKVVGGGEAFAGAASVAVHGEKIYVLTSSGIHEVRTSDAKTTLMVIKKDDQWGTVGSLVSFAGNLYLLDTQKSRVWKYVSGEKDPPALPAGRQAAGQGFSELREYLNPDTLPDLSRATGMNIDGSVWAGTTDGKLFRFTQGKENTFIPQGVTPTFGNMLVVYARDDANNVYVLDAQNKRVVVLAKNGIYLAQYVWTGGLTPTQLVVSEKLKLILLLADGKLYSVELK